MEEVIEFVNRAVERPYDIPLNVAVWIAFKPMIKIYLSIGVGFLLVKCKCDLPLAYVQTIGESPFLPESAAAQGVSYSVLIVIIFVIFTFNLGGTRLVEWDFTRDEPRPEDPTIPPLSYQACKRLIRRWTGHETEADRKVENEVKEEKKKDKELIEEHKAEQSHGELGTDSNDNNRLDTEAQRGRASTDHSKRSSDHDILPYNEDTCKQSSDNYNAFNGDIRPGDSAVSEQGIEDASKLNADNKSLTQSMRSRVMHERPYGSTDVYYSRMYTSDPEENGKEFADAPSRLDYMDDDAPSGFQNLQRQISRTESTKTPKNKKPNGIQRAWKSFKRGWFRIKAKNKVNTYICNFCEDIFLPQMMALIAGITVCMIPWVRRVFVKGQDISNFNDAPDANPPLDFLMDFLSFFAGAQVPLGLMLLGGTMGSLKIGKTVPGFWKTLIMICIFKLALLPIIACAWIHRIREIGWLSKSDAMTPIVLAVASGTPSATVQIYLTLAWIDPTKESPVLNSLAIALMAQYLFLPITMTFLVTYVVMHYV